MKPFEMIQSLDAIISDLKYAKKYSKNKIITTTFASVIVILVIIILIN